jgi:hypothetical protein
METDVFSGLGDWAYLAAIAIPIIIGLLTKASWPGWAKFLAALALSIIVGVITVWKTTGNWEWSPVFILSIIGAAEAFYNVIVKPTGLGDWLAGKLVKDKPPA